MTKEKLKELLPVMQAWVDGKAVQVRMNHKPDEVWNEYTPADSTDSLSFFNPHLEWRIKPEPREFWLIKEPTDFRAVCTMSALADTYRHDLSENPGREIIHVKEVI